MRVNINIQKQEIQGECEDESKHSAQGGFLGELPDKEGNKKDRKQPHGVLGGDNSGQGTIE